MTAPSNSTIATLLSRIADLLEAKGESTFRVRSYRNAAETVRTSRLRIAARAVHDGENGLRGLPGIGEKLAGLIREYVLTGSCELLGDLEKEVPNGSNPAPAKHAFPRPLLLPVGTILAIDEEYRAKAAANSLRRIAPKLQNPEKKAWLPVLSLKRDGVSFTAMFSIRQPRTHWERPATGWSSTIKKGKRRVSAPLSRNQKGR